MPLEYSRARLMTPRSDMSETTLETLRRQMHDSEMRMKRSADEGAKKVPASQKHTQGNAEPAVVPPEPDDPTREWAAYGQMTPGFLNEVSAFIAENLQDILQKVPARTEPEMAGFIQTVDMVQSLLSKWIESADRLPSAVGTAGYPDLLGMALSVRRAEFLRWGIQVDLDDATVGMEAYDCPLSLFQATLHVMQYCIEQLQGVHGASRLLIRMQNQGGRLETSFAWDSSRRQGSAGPVEPGLAPHGRNLELQAAQKLLNRLGGSLILENIGEVQRAVRMTLSLAALPAAGNLRRAPRS